MMSLPRLLKERPFTESSLSSVRKRDGTPRGPIPGFVELCTFAVDTLQRETQLSFVSGHSYACHQVKYSTAEQSGVGTGLVERSGH